VPLASPKAYTVIYFPSSASRSSPSLQRVLAATPMNGAAIMCSLQALCRLKGHDEPPLVARGIQRLVFSPTAPVVGLFVFIL
jgi:hypothetical protein